MDTIFCVSDLHINSTVGLLGPGRIKLPDGNTIVQSDAQAWTWSKFESFLDSPVRGRLVTFINGEIADNNYHRTTQLHTTDPASIIELALATIEPLVRKSEVIIVTRGSEAHAGIGSHLDEIIAKEIGAEKLGTDSHAHWWANPTIGGVKFDIAHHPRFGQGSYHTSHNTAGKLAADMIMYSAKFGGLTPDVMIRSHNHTFSDSGLNYPVRAFVTPPWQLSTHFSHRLGYGGKLLPVGGMVFYCNNGKYNVQPKLYMPEKSKYVEL